VSSKPTASLRAAHAQFGANASTSDSEVWYAPDLREATPVDAMDNARAERSPVLLNNGPGEAVSLGSYSIILRAVIAAHAIIPKPSIQPMSIHDPVM
jgi:hypothetical protein